MKGKKSFHRLRPGALMADTDRWVSVGQEALSVVSEDQPIFEPPYTAAPAMHMKAEMTSPGGFSQASKQSPEPTEPEWVGSAAQNPGKRGEHVNGTRWVRIGRGHKGAQVPGLSDCSLQSVSTSRIFPDPKNICLLLTNQMQLCPYKSPLTGEHYYTSVVGSNIYSSTELQ